MFLFWLYCFLSADSFLIVVFFCFFYSAAVTVLGGYFGRRDECTVLAGWFPASVVREDITCSVCWCRGKSLSIAFYCLLTASQGSIQMKLWELITPYTTPQLVVCITKPWAGETRSNSIGGSGYW